MFTFTKLLKLPEPKQVIKKGKLLREFNHSFTPYWFSTSLSMSDQSKFTRDIIEWCEENCQGRFSIDTKMRNGSTFTYWFKRENDCTHFKLVWCNE